MGVFQVFKIVQMVGNPATHHNDGFTNKLQLNPLKQLN